MSSSYKGNLVRDARTTAAWLAQGTVEAVSDPDLPIIDAHHHLWDPPGKGMCYLLDEFQADLQSGHRIVSTVFIEAGAMYRPNGPEHLRPVGEVEFARDVAAMAASRNGESTRVAEAIVGHADLSRGTAVQEVLEAQIEAAGGRMRGIRHATVFDPGEVGRYIARYAPPHLLGDRAFRQGVSQLQRLGLSFDAWVFHTQLDDVRQLAAAFPDLTIVLDHAGTLLGVADHVNRVDAARQEWHRGLQALSRMENVFVKIGGLAMPMCGHDLHTRPRPPDSETLARVWGPAVKTCIDLFGPERCMFESNFPVDRQSCSYVALWNAFKRITRSMEPDERRALFGGTAARCYRIKAP
jgi:L-fuconolactonase